MLSVVRDIIPSLGYLYGPYGPGYHFWPGTFI